MMIIWSTTPYSKRNLYIKATISLFIGLGISCAIFAIRSCRWFVFVKDETDGNRLIEEWEFFPEIKNSTISVGLFWYETSYLYEGGNKTSTMASSENYDNNFININDDNAANNVRCEPYPEFWGGDDYQWKCTAQLFVMLGPIIAFQSWCLAIVGANRFWICTFLLLAMGLQTATVISSLSWCDRYWNCPWLLGAKVNLVAACSFLLGWLFAMLGLVDNSAGNNSNEQQDSRKKKNSEERILHTYDINEQGESSSVNITNEFGEGQFSSTSGEINSLDLEYGSNVMDCDPSMRDDGDDSETVDEYEKMNDDDDEEDNDRKRKSININKKRVFQSNQIFHELGPRLEQRRYKIEDTNDAE